MKITFLVPHFKISGGLRVVLTYANLLAQRGNEVIIIAPIISWREMIMADIFKHGAKAFFRKNYTQFKRVRTLEEKNLNPSDITMAFNITTAEWLNSYSERMGKKFYSVQHDEGLYHFDQERAYSIFKHPLRFLVVSTWLKEVLKNKYGVDSKLVLNSVDKKLFRPIETKKKDDEIRILLMHHTYEWKGTKEGIEIIQRLKNKYPNIKLILFGARQEKIDFSCDEYHYNLPQEKLAWLYSGCDIFLCPSWDEGFGLPSLEAMACKCALVTYDNGGSRDFAFDGETALVAERRDIADLESKLEILIKDADLRGKIAERGYRFVQKIPTWEEQAEKMEEIFKKSVS